MGHPIKINDTLKLERGNGFPKEELIIDKTYEFKRPGIRLYNFYPTRAFLVEEIEGKWNYRAHVYIIE